MKSNVKRFLKAAQVAVGTGLYLMDRSERFAPRVREKLVGQIDDLRDRARDSYEAAANRVASISKTLRRSNSSRTGWHVLRFAVGLGVGIGAAVLLAPANGEQTRAKLAGKAQDFGGRVRHRLASHDLPGTAMGN